MITLEQKALFVLEGLAIKLQGVPDVTIGKVLLHQTRNNLYLPLTQINLDANELEDISYKQQPPLALRLYGKGSKTEPIKYFGSIDAHAISEFINVCCHTCAFTQ